MDASPVALSLNAYGVPVMTWSCAAKAAVARVGADGAGREQGRSREVGARVNASLEKRSGNKERGDSNEWKVAKNERFAHTAGEGRGGVKGDLYMSGRFDRPRTSRKRKMESVS